MSASFADFLSTYQPTSFDSLVATLREHEPLVRVVSQEDLFMLKHIGRDESLTPFMRATRGLIGSKLTLEVVAPGVPMAVTPGAETDRTLLESLESDPEQPVQIAPVVDGVTFRLYYVNESQSNDPGWYYSTTGMIYPNRGWRGIHTFADLFVTHFDERLSLGLDSPLNQEYCYFLTLACPEHHNVVHYENNWAVITQITGRDGLVLPLDQTSEEVRRLNAAVDGWVELAKGEQEDRSEPPLFEFIWQVQPAHQVAQTIQAPRMRDPSGPCALAGYQINLAGASYRVESESYKAASQLRTNKPDLLEIWASYLSNRDRMNDYLEYFPSDQPRFLQFHRQLRDLAAKLHKMYGLKYRRRQEITCSSRHELVTLRRIHGMYIERCATDNRHPITYQDVEQYLYHLPAPVIRCLLRPPAEGVLGEQTAMRA